MCTVYCSLVEDYCSVPAQHSPPGKGRVGGYVPRSQRYNHLLDSAYDDIRKTSSTAVDGRGLAAARSPNLLLQPDSCTDDQPTPAVSDDDEEEQAFMQVLPPSIEFPFAYTTKPMVNILAKKSKVQGSKRGTKNFLSFATLATKTRQN